MIAAAWTRAAIAATALAWVVATPPIAVAAPASPDATSAERFTHHLARARAARGAHAHWALAEAQRLAPQIGAGWERLVPVAKALATSSRVPWLRGEAHGTIAAARRADDPARARSEIGRAGVVTCGAVLGPLAGPGTDASPPEAGFDPRATLPGKRGPIGWRPFAEASDTGALRVGDLIDADADAHAFIAVSLDVERTTDAMIVLGSNGPLGAWLDGDALFTWDGARRLSDWQHAVPVRLSAGTHQLWIRVGHRVDEPRLIARIIDRDGLTPDGVTIRAPRPDDALGAWTPSTRMPPPLADLAGDDPALRGKIGLYVAPRPDGQRDAARALEEAIARHPDDAELHYLLGRAEESEVSRRVAALEAAVRLARGRHAEALADLTDIYRAEQLDALADDAARRLATLDPSHPTWRVHHALRIAETAGAAAALPTLTDDPRRETSPRVAIAWASLLDQAERYDAAGEAFARAAWLTGGSSQMVAAAVDHARQADRSEQAVAWAERALGHRPYASELMILRARARATAEGPDVAAAELRGALEIHPGSSELHELLGRLELLAGDRGAALAAVDRALDLAPQNRPLADYRRALLGDQQVATFEAADVTEVIAAAEDVPASDEGATFLAERHAIEVHPSGLSSHVRQQIVRIEEDRAADPFQEMRFPFTPGDTRVELIEAEVLHPDGTRSRPRQVFDHQPEGKQMGVYTLRALRVVRFRSLSAGDVVHIQVRTDEIGARNLFGDFFGTIVPLQSTFPKRDVEVVIDAPASRALHADGAGVSAPARSDDGERQLLTWRLDALPAIQIEPQMPGYGDVGAYISVSTFSDWQTLARWYSELVRPQLSLSSSMRATAQRLIAGLDTTHDKVAAIQAWVVRETRYVGIEFGIHGFKPYRVTEVVERGYGDCKDKTSLLIAMLDAVGIDAEFVLVRTRDLGALTHTPPTLWAFNHAIAYVPELDAYIDGTSEYAGLGELPELDQGAMVLRIALDDRTRAPVLTRVPMASPEDNRVRATSRYTIAPDGDARARFHERYAGTIAPTLRARFSERSTRDGSVAEVIAAQFPGATVDAVSYDHIEDLGVPVVIEIDATLPGFAERDGDTLRVPVTFGDDGRLARYGNLGERRQPLMLEHTVMDVEDMSFHLPEGASVGELPAPVHLDTAFGRYQLTFAEAPFGFTARSEIAISETRIAPEDYPAFRTFLEQIARAERVRVVVRLPRAGIDRTAGPTPRR